VPYVDSGGLRLYYGDSGSGPAVLWHTGGCGDSTMWETAGYIAALPGYRHILFDHRGRGRSDGPPDVSGHQMSCYTGDVIAVLDDAGIESAVLIGYSMGGRVGYAVAASHPGRLAGMVGLDSVPDPASQPAELRRDAGKVMAEGTRAVIQEMADAESEPPPPWLLEHLCTTDAATFAGAFEAFATAPPFWPDRRVGVVLSAQYLDEAAVAVADLPPLAVPGTAGQPPIKHRGRHAQAAEPATGWIPTDERFRDPTTRVVMRVWIDPADQSRHYVPEPGG